MHCFFFSSRRRHTRWPRDWSSDVCSSDLGGHEQLVAEHEPHRHRREASVRVQDRNDGGHVGEIGRASCRERVEMSGEAVSIKKKNTNKDEKDEESQRTDKMKREQDVHTQN